MAYFVTVENPFDQSGYRTDKNPAATVLSYLKSKYKGFKEFTSPTVICVNDEPLMRGNWDVRKLKEDDIVTIIPVVGGVVSIIVAVVVAVAVAVVAINFLAPTPQTPGSVPEPDSVYTLAGQYNQYKLGEPIEVCYGQVRRWPSYAAATYNKYVDQEQFLFALFCVGQGDFEVGAVMIEDTPITNFEDAQFTIIRPYADPSGLFENNVITSSEVGGQELFGPNEDEYPNKEDPDPEERGWIGPFIANPEFTTTDYLEADLVFPAGLYFANDDGGLNSREVQFEINIQRVDDTGVPYGDWLNPEDVMRGTFYYREVTKTTSWFKGNSRVTVGKWVAVTVRKFGDFIKATNLGDGLPTRDDFEDAFGVELDVPSWGATDGEGEQGDTLIEEAASPESIDGIANMRYVREYGAGWKTYRNRTTTPLRFTRKYFLPELARWQVRVRRRNNASNSHRVGDTLEWEKLRAFLPATSDFGGVTLLAFEARASNSLNDNSQQRFNLFATRRLPTWDSIEGWSAPVATRSIVWAFCDVFRAKYGGRFVDEYLDLEDLASLDAFYEAREDYFDYVFDRKMTVLEAAKTIARAGRGVPMVKGSKITIVRDGPASLPTAMFGPHNILKDTFSWEIKLQQELDNDAVEAVYIDPNTFKEEVVICALEDDPETPLNPKRVTMSGITDRDKAYREGLYIRATERLQREQISFSTGLEGRVPNFGDLIGVSHDVPQWGTTGHVRSIEGVTITLKEEVSFTEGLTHQILLRQKNGEVVGPLTVTEGADSRTVELAAPILTDDFILDGSGTAPLFSFGVINEFYHLMKVTRITSRGNDALEIKCVNYAGDVYNYDSAIAPPLNEGLLIEVPDAPEINFLRVEALPNTLEQVAVKWQGTSGTQRYILDVSTDDGATWSGIAETQSNYYTLQVTPGEIQIRVAAIGQQQGPWKTWEGIVGEIPEPVSITPNGGGFITSQFPVGVSVTSPTLGATIRYSFDAMPQNDSDGFEYVGSVDVSEGQTIYARAFAGGILAGDGDEATFILVPNLDFSLNTNSQYKTLI